MSDHDHSHSHEEHSHGDHDHDHSDGHAHHGGLRARISHMFKPHSHDAADSVDSVLEASVDGMRALKRSFVILTVTALLQVVVVLISSSVALLADTIHNFADALTAIPLAIAFSLGRRKPTRRYTYGYGRSEDLAGLFILLVISVSAVLAGWEAIDRLFHPQTVSNVGWVMAAGLIGFVGNEIVATYRIRVGRRIGSAALVADGLHARTDGLTSLAVVFGAVGVALGFQNADPIVGLVITVAILAVLRSAVRDIYRRLMDSVDPEQVDEVEHLLGHVPGVVSVGTVQMRWIGHRLYVEADIVCTESISLIDAHNIGEEARHGLLHSDRRLADAKIHTSPPGAAAHALTAHHFVEQP